MNGERLQASESEALQIGAVPSPTLESRCQPRGTEVPTVSLSKGKVRMLNVKNVWHCTFARRCLRPAYSDLILWLQTNIPTVSTDRRKE